VPKLKNITYLLAIAIFFAFIPLKVRATPIQVEISSGGDTMDIKAFTVTDTSIPYQFSLSATPGFKISFILFKDHIVLFKVDHIESMGFKIVLKPGDYRLALSATGPENGSAVGEASPVPVPSAVILFGTSLMGLIGLSRRQKNASFSIFNNSSPKGYDGTISVAN
jgi:hypothetical protein